METVLELPDFDLEEEKMSSLLHGFLQSRISYLFELTYSSQYSVITELDLSFASGKTRPDLCVFPKLTLDWLADEIVVTETPLTTIEILSPAQNLTALIDRVYAKHFPAGVKSVWIVSPPLKLITIFLPDRSRINFSTGLLTDPATNIEMDLAAVFV